MNLNVALSTGELAVIAIVPTLLLAGWLIAIFLANRDQGRHSGPAHDGRPPSQEAGMTLPPSGPQRPGQRG
jgi:hypothetical protein